MSNIILLGMLICIILGIAACLSIKVSAERELYKMSRIISEKKSHFKIHQSKMVTILLVLITILLLVIFVSDLLKKVIDIYTVVGLIASLLMLLYCVFWEIRISKQEIVFRNIFKMKTVYFSSVTKVKQGRRNALIVYSGTKRMFTVEPNCEGYFELLAILKIKKIPIENKN
ncbi:DUF6560 family protein [Enterococcus avium]